MLGTVSANAGDLAAPRRYGARAGPLRRPRRHLSRRCAGCARMGVRLAQHHQAGLKVARWLARAARGRARAASGARKPSRPRALAARFLRRQRPVQHRVQAGARRPRSTPSSTSSRCSASAHRGAASRAWRSRSTARRSARATKWAPGGPTVRIPHRARGRRRPHRRSERGFAAFAAAR